MISDFEPTGRSPSICVDSNGNVRWALLFSALLMPKVVIVGAGISGLALAYCLQREAPTCDIQVLEQRTRPGGTIWTAEHGGFRFEHGPNGFLDNKPTTITLCRDLGLADRLIQASEAAGRNRYLFLDGELRALPAGLGAFLRT